MIMSCKCATPDLWAGPSAGVFTDWAVLDYYDGPTTAVCKCAACGSPKLISVISWDPSLWTIRVFGMAAITPDAFQTIVDRLRVRERLLASGDRSLDDDYEGSLSRLVREFPEPDIVLASKDLLEEILAARRLNPRGIRFSDPVVEVSGDHFADWLIYLGIPPEPIPSQVS